MSRWYWGVFFCFFSKFPGSKNKNVKSTLWWYLNIFFAFYKSVSFWSFKEKKITISSLPHHLFYEDLKNLPPPPFFSLKKPFPTPPPKVWETSKDYWKIIAHLFLSYVGRIKKGDLLKLQFCDCSHYSCMSVSVPWSRISPSLLLWVVTHPTTLNKKATLKTQGNKSVPSKEQHSGKQSTNTFSEHGNKK